MDCTVPDFDITEMLGEKFLNYKRKLEQMMVAHNLKEGEVISLLVEATCPHPSLYKYL